MLNLAPMTRTKKKTALALEDWQQEDARRLRNLFAAHTPKLSQGEFGARYSIGTQGMVWQYLHGHRPLNASALGKFAHGLGVAPQDISPTLTREITQLAEASKGPRLNPALQFTISETPARPIRVVSAIEPDDRGAWEKPLKSSEHYGYVNAPSEDPQAYAVRILGDELQPRVRPGEYLLLEPSRPVEPGDEVIVRTAKACMIREYLFAQDGNVVLCAINGGHGRHTVAQKDIIEMTYVAAIVKRTRFIPA